MELETGRDKFIQAWGVLGSKWGINRSMAQVQAVLLISPEPLSAEDVMEQLSISRGNANMNLRGLIDWGVVRKVHIPGERKEFFEAEKDMWTITRQVLVERRRRELEPVLRMLEEVREVKPEKGNEEHEEFVKVMGDLDRFSRKVDKAFDRMLKADGNRFSKAILNFMMK